MHLGCTDTGSAMTATAKKRKKKDGRALRAERSRQAVARAMLDLIRESEGDPRPTAAAVAERAGVSLRLVFHHFKDMDAVLRHAMDLQALRIAPLVPIDLGPCRSVDEKVTAFCERRAMLYEEITPTRRAANTAASSSPKLAENLTHFRAAKRDQLAYLFRDEVGALPEELRAARLAAAQQATSWMAWESLRAHQGLDVAGATEVMAASLRALLGGGA